MSKRIMLIVAALAVFLVVPALADNAGCKNKKFVGSYTAPNLNFDLFGDGSFVHDLVFQLTLHGDGTATQYWTGLPDFEINAGTGSPWIGSWTCRQDGMLVVTFLRANYGPTPPGPNHPLPDISLAVTIRNTYLFRIDDDNSITRIQARARLYTPSQDPTDPNGGTLNPINSATVAYTRLEATDADLLLP